MLVVQKYGGTSVASVERIRAVAERCLRARREGHDLVVVVSAMAGETNRLLALASQVAKEPTPRELDMLAATGEQVSVALLAMAIQDLGGDAISFLGHQIQLVTDSAFTRARIKRINHPRLFEALEQRNIVVVAGFQGMDEAGNITTLGRGGSDTSAVAIAAALKADLCEIYTDVDGVYTADPNICPTARLINRISHEEMLELASLGAKVLQIRCVEFAMKYRVPLVVRSSFHDGPGTTVVWEEPQMEGVVVTGVALDRNEAKVTLTHVPDQPGVAARIFKSLAEADIVVDMIIQNASAAGYTDLTFTVPKGDLKKAALLVRRTAVEVRAKETLCDENIAKVSIVGLGMRSHSGVAQKMFELLSSEGINIQMISTSEIKISCVIDAKYGELAVRTLHDGFDVAATSSG